MIKKSLREKALNKKGFTLIELLVVIAIIGLLSTMTVYAINVARMKARDARRLADIKQIQKALELYYDENNEYPRLNVAYTTTSFCGNGSRWCALETALASFLKDLPRDPLGLQNTYRYYYDSDSGDNYQTYGLMIRFESEGNFHLVDSDGGYYSGSGTYYEIGSQPIYCRDKYTSSDGNWWGGQTTVCVGGN